MLSCFFCLLSKIFTPIDIPPQYLNSCIKFHFTGDDVTNLLLLNIRLFQNVFTLIKKKVTAPLRMFCAYYYFFFLTLGLLCERLYFNNFSIYLKLPFGNVPKYTLIVLYEMPKL